tara:strand:- start:4050 stop:4412 length:363 start_codon:yes stop_codon:yes gene_type:complete
MKLQKLRPMIWTDKFEETIDFYTKIIEFNVGEKNVNWGWASLYKDEVEIMVAKPNEHTPFEKSVFTGSFYFNTDQVNQLWEHLKDKTKICYEIENFEWKMREFAIYDNNGYILQFGQNIE